MNSSLLVTASLFTLQTSTYKTLVLKLLSPPTLQGAVQIPFQKLFSKYTVKAILGNDCISPLAFAHTVLLVSHIKLFNYFFQKKIISL